MEYEFEKYPRLAEMMQECASFGKFSNWSEFIEELNKALQQVKSVDLADVVGRSEQCCSPTDGFYLGTTCPHCNKPFRKDIR